MEPWLPPSTWLMPSCTSWSRLSPCGEREEGGATSLNMRVEAQSAGWAAAGLDSPPPGLGRVAGPRYRVGGDRGGRGTCLQRAELHGELVRRVLLHERWGP